MKIKFGRHFSSIVLGLMVIGLMAPAAVRAQSGQTPSNSSSSNAQSNNSTTNSTSSTKKSKKSKSTSTTDAGGTSGSTAGGGTSGSAAAPASSTKSAAPSIAATPATADTHAANNNKTSAAGSTPPSPGMVWVNTSTKVYHKSGSKYYGNTKQGKWMSEADAQKAGFKAASN
jgi:hypothetical protein